MSDTQSNIVVDVRQALSPRSGNVLVEALGNVRGVSRASISTSAPRLVLVDYDPAQIDTQRILGVVMRRGFDARLVGM